MNRRIWISGIFLFLYFFSFGQVTVSGSLNADGTYTSLTKSDGAFQKINANNQSGKSIIISITGNCTEDGTNGLTGVSGMWNSLTIQPSGGSRTISGNVSGSSTTPKALIDLNGADKVTISGLNSNGNSLTIINSSTSTYTSTIRLINGATYDTIKNCTVSGSAINTPDAPGGNVYFSNGNNSYNGITGCNLNDYNSSCPAFMVFSSSSGTNANNTVSGCNIYNYFNAVNVSGGIYLINGSTNWTIINNSFYQTGTRVVSNSGLIYCYSIYVSNSVSGVNFSINNNYIGGQSAQCGGSAMTYSYYGNNKGGAIDFIDVSTCAVTNNSTSIQGNYIKNISFSSDNSFTDEGFIVVWNGPAAVLYNQIGDVSSNNSIVFSPAGHASNIILKGIGVGNNSSGTQSSYNVSSNQISGITISSGGGGVEFRGIEILSLGTTSASTSYTIYGNTIGSELKSNSLYNGSDGTSTIGGIKGIFANIGGNSSILMPCEINYNTVANLSFPSSGTNTGYFEGIHAFGNLIGGVYYGKFTIIGNNIHDLTFGGANTVSIAISGINHDATYDDGQNISRNNIYNLISTFSNGQQEVDGITYSCPNSSGNLVEKNFIRQLISRNTSIYVICAIDEYSGNAVVCNNFVSLGYDETGQPITTDLKFVGFLERSNQSVNHVYFNSFYIGGTGTGSNPTYAMRSDLQNSPSTRYIENNIFYNSRVGGGTHYALNLTSNSPLVSDYNDLYSASGTVGELNGTNCSTLSNWQTTTNQDAHSISQDPLFVRPNGTPSQIDLHITDVTTPSPCMKKGLYLSDITDDYDGDIRHSPPDLGADEFQLNGNFVWRGGTSTDWRTASNWEPAYVPTSMDDVTIDPAKKITYYPLLTSYNMALCHSATILNGGSVSISSGKSLNITGKLTIKGTEGIIIKSDINGTGSLMYGSLDDNNGAGTARVEKYEVQNCWHYITPPVDNCLSGVFLRDHLRYYDETAGNWGPYIVPTTVVLTPPVMKGYEVYSKSSIGAWPLKTFSGRLYSGSLSINLTRTPARGGGWNLIGNPFVCALDLLSSGITWTNIDKVVYYWSPSMGNYVSYVVESGAGTGSRYVPAMQGFFVKVNSSYLSGTFGVSNAAMALSIQQFYKNSDDVQEKIMLEASNKINTYFDKTLICFNQNASDTFESNLDAYKWAGNYDSPQLYTKTSDDYSVSVYSMPWRGVNKVIPVYFSSGVNGDYTLSMNELESYTVGKNIFLEDKELNSIAEFSTEKPYSFKYTTGSDPARFNLLFKKPKDTGGNNPKTSAQSGSENDISIYSFEKTFYVSTGNAQRGDVYVYNLLGKIVYTGKLIPSTLNRFETDLNPDLYIVKVVPETGSTQSQKILIR